MPFRTPRATSALPVVLFVLSSPVAAQEADTLWTGVHDVEARWLHADQVPGLVHFETSDLRFRLDSLELAAGRFFRFGVGPSGRRVAELEISPGGEIEAAWVAPQDDGRVRDPDPLGVLSRRAYQLTSGGGVLLDDSRIWDIALPRPPDLEPGATSRDTLRLRAERFGFSQSITGPRVTTLLRDTVVEGRRLWIGLDSADVEYREHMLDPKRSLDAPAVVERIATGTLRGRFVYDPTLGLFRTRHDTLVVDGEAILRLPRGAEYRTPASYERRTRWVFRSPSEQRAWREEEARRRESDSFSILVLPRTPVEQRIRAGDGALVDSLLEAWSDAELREREEIERAFLFGIIGPDVRARFDSIRAEEGGPGWRVEQMADYRLGFGPPLDSAEMALYLEYLRDPGLAFAGRIDTDPLYENLSNRLVSSPPTLEADSTRWACTPAACRLVAAERDASEPRLRQVALVAAFILEPERWVDSVLATADPAPHLVRPAVMLARGVADRGPQEEGPAIPEPGAGWREWQRWSGVDPDDPPSREYPPAAWRRGHAHAVRMTERLSGRDIGTEWVEAADTAVDPMGRAVLRTLALNLDALRPSLEEIATGVLAQDTLERTLAFLALDRRFAEAQPADSAVNHEVLGQFLAQRIGGEAIWTGGSLPPGLLAQEWADRPPFYLAAEGIPAPLQAEWDARPEISVVSAGEWNAQDPRSPGMLLRVGRVETLGPFARITYSSAVRRERGPGRGPRGYASGESYTLLRTDEGWRVIRGGASWIS